MRAVKIACAFILLMLVRAVLPARTVAQERLVVRCYYPVNVTDRTESFADSASVFRTLDSLLSGGCRVDSVHISGWASPEADAERNLMLSRLRAENLRNRLVFLHPALADKITVDGKGENWEPVVDYLTETSDPDVAPYRNQLLNLATARENEQERENAFRQVGRGVPWKRIVEQACPAARIAEAVILFCSDPEKQDEATPEPAGMPPLPSLPSGPVVPALSDTVYTRVTLRDWNWALRTNALVPAANIGAQWTVGRHVSLGADWYFPWIWPPRRNAWCIELLGLGLEGRWWFVDGTDPLQRWTGHSVGCSVMAGYYDFEMRYRGLQGEYLHLGLDYGWTFPLFQGRYRLTLAAGVGYLHSRFRTYSVPDAYGRLYRDGLWTERLDWFGPTRLEASLVIPFWREITYVKEVMR